MCKLTTPNLAIVRSTAKQQSCRRCGLSHTLLMNARPCSTVLGRLCTARYITRQREDLLPGFCLLVKSKDAHVQLMVPPFPHYRNSRSMSYFPESMVLPCSPSTIVTLTSTSTAERVGENASTALPCDYDLPLPLSLSRRVSLIWRTPACCHFSLWAY